MGEMWENLGDPRNLLMLNRRQVAFHQGARSGGDVGKTRRSEKLAHAESPWSSPLPNPPSSATEGPPLTVLLINFVSPHRTMIIADEFLFILS